MKCRKNKIQLNATVSPITMKRLVEMMEVAENFSSRSDAVEKSLDMMYFSWKYNEKSHENAVMVG